LQSLIFRMPFDWIQVTGLFSFSSFQDFIDSCSSHYLLPQYTSSIHDGPFLIKHIIYKKKKKRKRKKEEEVLNKFLYTSLGITLNFMSFKAITLLGQN
jgi:hypothetical protein